ncbi:MAG: hypothetical protein OEZ06_25915 [Myxococcales bacterium]|nr:hypothetical protein [Myxococcales bacterium]
MSCTHRLYLLFLTAGLALGCSRAVPLDGKKGDSTSFDGVTNDDRNGGGAGSSTGSGTAGSSGGTSPGSTPGTGGGTSSGTGGTGGSSVGGSPDCSPDGWCCDSSGTCCNDSLGVCEIGAAGSDGSSSGFAGSGSGFAGSGSGGGVAIGRPIPIGPGFGPMLPGGGGSIDLGECSQDGASAGPGWCDTQYSCENGYLWANCNDGGDGWYCYCENGFSFQEYRLSGASGSAACTAVADFCASGESPTGSDLTCTPRYAEQGPEYCSKEVECSSSVDLGGDVSAETLEWRYTWCNVVGGIWSCECNSNREYIRIEFSDSQSNPQVCSDVSDICTSGDIEVTSDPVCTFRNQWVDRGWCDAGLQCSQDALVGGQEAQVFSDRWVSCSLTSSDTWECSCNTGATATTYQLTGDDAWSLCTAAGERCADF